MPYTTLFRSERENVLNRLYHVLDGTLSFAEQLA